MPADTYSHSDYLNEFQQFMQTGEKSQLDSYLEDSRPAAFLSVYRNGFIRASVSALESNFPSLVKLWGEDYFSQVAGAYVNVVPPSSATLIGYGFDACVDGCVVGDSEPSVLSFIEFLQQNITEVIDQFPYVSDICSLDQAWLESLNENGESFLTLTVVQEMIEQGEDLAELPLTLVDSSRVVILEFDIFELWGQLRFGKLEEDQKIELKSHYNSVIFWQRDLQVQAKPLSAVEAVFIQSLKQSADFDIATNQALATDESFDVSILFAELLNAQLLQQQNKI
ncbi:MAG: DNA-binding domain-containing protein [Cocleimonas sp.]